MNLSDDRDTAIIGIHTVNNQTITMPIKTAKNSQAVHAVALNPVKIFATITADIAIVYTNCLGT